MNVKVKICGVRNIKAAKTAVETGADFLGFNFVPASKRYLPPERAKEIIRQIKGKVKIVGVFQDAEIHTVNEITSILGLDLVQLHGNEDNEYIAQMRVPVIKSINIYVQIQKMHADYFLLDRVKQGEGEIVDSIKGAQLANKFQLFLAGGLTPDNVVEQITQMKPFAVDTAAGIETNGRQDLNKIRAFIKNVKKTL